VRLVALFEGFKGVIVLVAASGLLLLIHKDVHAIAARLVEHTHLNPAAKYPQIFLDAANSLHNSTLVLLALGAAAYSAVRLIEAYGLFYGRAWAEVLAACSGAIYLPFELFELVRQATTLRAALLLANVAVVAIMVRALLQRRRAGAQNEA
jgi:uncharacterized membrane protein (DUF2068 family)